MEQLESRMNADLLGSSFAQVRAFSTASLDDDALLAATPTPVAIAIA
jgi:hypothetical protein